MSVLVGAVDHGRGFSRPDFARVGIGFRFGGQMMRLRSRRGATSLRLQLLVGEIGAQLLAGNFPQVLAVKVEGILAGNVPDHSGVGDLTQPLLQLHCLAATVPGILLQLYLHQRATNILQGPSICQALQTVSPQVQMSQRHRSGAG